MEEENKMKFACTKLKGHTMIWWDHVKKDRTKNGKSKIKTWDKMEKKLREFSCRWTMHKPFFVDFRTGSKTYPLWKNSQMSFMICPFMWITKKLMSNWPQGM